MTAAVAQADRNDPTTGITPRQRYLQRWISLKAQRTSWDAHWRELGENFRPRRPRFSASDFTQQGSRRNDGIINATPLRAARILSAGMMSGITSPARSWFRLTTPDSNLAEAPAVRAWLHQVEQRIRTAFARSNFYNSLQLFYADLATFGTAVLFMDEDPDDLIRCYTFPVGTYALAQSAQLRINSLYRSIPMTVNQMVEKFGLENVSGPIKEAFQGGRGEEWRGVCHVVEPNVSFITGRLGPKGMPWRSLYFEDIGLASNAVPGQSALVTDHAPTTGFLRESGYRSFPIMAARWETTAEDYYGHGPGMDALGDAKALQLMESDKLTALEKAVNPPMVGPEELRQNGKASLIPGGLTYLTDMRPGLEFKPAHVIDVRAIQLAGEEIAKHELRVNQTFFVDLFLMLASSDRRQITAREIAERHEEKMLMLGPVLERLTDELLDPAIDRCFDILATRGELPPPPQELQGMDLKVEYISPMAQAQKLLAAGSIERLTGFVGSVVEAAPDVLDNLNLDKVVREYADVMGTRPDLLRTEEETAELRRARAERQQQQEQTEQAMAAAKGAGDLARANITPDNALGALVSQLGGPAGATPVQA